VLRELKKREKQSERCQNSEWVFSLDKGFRVRGLPKDNRIMNKEQGTRNKE
jgi:hypothetical protein